MKRITGLGSIESLFQRAWKLRADCEVVCDLYWMVAVVTPHTTMLQVLRREGQ